MAGGGGYGVYVSDLGEFDMAFDRCMVSNCAMAVGMSTQRAVLAPGTLFGSAIAARISDHSTRSIDSIAKCTNE